MNLYDLPPLAAALDAASHLVTGLAAALEPLAGGASAAAAIVLVTLLVRVLLIPVGISQGRAEITRRRLAPLLRELQRKHSKNPEALQRATMKLYADEKASPLAGCLPVLLQAPVLSLLYGLFVHPDIAGHGNALLDARLLDVPLGRSFVAALGGGEPAQLGVFAVLLGVIALVSWLARRVALRQAALTPVPEGTPGAVAQLTGVLSWMPFLTVLFAAFVPLAATLYLTVTTTWTLCERSIVRRVLAGGARA
ncbi:membrane protein insertase YidC [Rathayibacter sp. VKM Ac-2760]|uniref:YidC/Oxa1 family membrane protein insertase n=1 Tax=Rathayibacter sp. VKM Ac-2760 TaxID=2609253 RepID=UPI001319B40D|nr:membrane protein insertase YidC [Rathayibacter sp. VKM Ac-2760]QHC59586.1 membrane protein insertase YidC [Rathayibacter sp. VKM Ac-2760]